MAGRGERRWIRSLAPLVTALALLAASAGAAAQYGSPNTSNTVFSDLGSVPWAQLAINNLANRGILQGVGGGRFDPDAAVTRGKLALVLSRVAPSQQPVTPPSFADVPAGSPLAAALRATWSYLGPVLGAGASFDPNATVQRQQVFAAIGEIVWTTSPDALAAKADPASVLYGFRDASSIEPSLTPWVAAAIGARLVLGNGSGYLDPTSMLTRAQLAVLIQRVSPGPNPIGSYVIQNVPGFGSVVQPFD